MVSVESLVSQRSENGLARAQPLRAALCRPSTDLRRGSRHQP
jgi:hypothetical protein